MSIEVRNGASPRVLVLGPDWQPFAIYSFPNVVGGLFNGDIVALDKWKVPYDFIEWSSKHKETGWTRWIQFSELLLDMSPQERGLDWEFFHLANSDKTPVAYPQICAISHRVQNWRRRRATKPDDNGIILRDGFQCAYCGRPVTMGKRHGGKFAVETATIDHVIPQSRFEKWAAQHNPKFTVESWQNKVCACHECNNNKGNKMNEEMGYKLRVKPYMPMWFLHDGIRVKKNHVKESWLEYLYPDKMKAL